ncbi:MAG TPA: rod shape-determining protein MreD [Anaerolineae bacterium]|nr:rod shape-determining protein MreD [Anaerolineae bacterium]
MNVYAAILLLGTVAIVQSTAIPHLAIMGVKPDLMLLVVMSWSLLRGGEEGLVWAFIGGLALDILSGAPFGASTLALMAVSFLSGLGEVRIFRTHIVLPLLTAFFATLVYDILFLLLLQMSGWPVAWLDNLVKVILPSALLNVALSPLVYQTLRWLHHATGKPSLLGG